MCAYVISGGLSDTKTFVRDPPRVNIARASRDPKPLFRKRRPTLQIYVYSNASTKIFCLRLALISFSNFWKLEFVLLVLLEINITEISREFQKELQEQNNIISFLNISDSF